MARYSASSNIPPTPPEIETLEQDYLHKQIAITRLGKGLPPRHPLMHRTLTIDYAIIMQGEIDMLLATARSISRPATCWSQQGTKPCLGQPGTEPVSHCIILIEAKEP